MKLPQLTGMQLANIVKRLGFVHSHTRGSHFVYKHADGRKVVIPQHSGENIGPGLLLKIIKKDLGMSKQEFFRFI